jgi:pimeloyl-ACP methyl ester carboxylesterase
MRLIFRVTVGAGLLLSTACAAFLPAPVPMRRVSYDDPSGHAQCLLVLLPGAGDSAEDFAQHGFIDEIRRRPLSVDVLAANATMGYYFRGTLPERLDADAIQPVLARGYKHIWATGISMGGFGTLFYSLRKPSRFDGIFLLAPFLGDDAVIREVHEAGGLQAWHAPPPAEPNEQNYQRQLWRWLQAVESGAEKGPDLYLGWGVDDPKIGSAASVLAAGLPQSHVSNAPGGHDWPAWRPLFSRMLDETAFRQACAAP